MPQPLLQTEASLELGGLSLKLSLACAQKRPCQLAHTQGQGKKDNPQKPEAQKSHGLGQVIGCEDKGGQSKGFICGQNGLTCHRAHEGSNGCQGQTLRKKEKGCRKIKMQEKVSGLGLPEAEKGFFRIEGHLPDPFVPGKGDPERSWQRCSKKGALACFKNPGGKEEKGGQAKKAKRKKKAMQGLSCDEACNHSQGPSEERAPQGKKIRFCHVWENHGCLQLSAQRQEVGLDMATSSALPTT